MDNDDQPTQAAPVQEEKPVEEVQEQAPEQEVTETQETEVTEPSQVNEGAEAPEPEEQEEESDFDPLASYGQYNQQQYQIPASEDGTVDPYQLMAAMEQRFDEKLRFQRQEESMWKKVEKKYPDVRSDKQTREILLSMRIANAVQGRETNMMKLADQLYGRTKDARSQGRAEANVSKKVQKAASLESATSNTGGNEKSDDRMDRIASGDKGAANDLLSQWLEEGKI